MARTKEDVPPNAPRGWEVYSTCGLCGQVTFYVGDDTYVNGVKAPHCTCWETYDFESEDDNE